MSCQEYEHWITGYIDGELSEPERRQLEGHVAECKACRRELERLSSLKEDLDMLKFREPSDADLDRYWANVYNRLERGIGWILFSLGAIIALGYGAIMFVEALLEDAEVPLLMKIGIVALVLGTVVLFVSLARERLSVRKTDKYSREVER